MNDSPTSQRRPKGAYALVSLGCPKNLVDSERMLGKLCLEGYQLVADASQADFVVVNTCGFIETARQESLEVIDEMLRLKKQGRIRGVIVAGCLAERQRQRLLQERPEVDALVGVFAREEIVKVADRLLGDLREQQLVFQPAPVRALPDSDRLRVTPPHFAYLKISEGCDRLCTFCAIPKMRGKHASKPVEQVVAEAEQLADQGARELIVIAQDTTYYGMDQFGEPKLAELLRRLEQVERLQWLRLMYLYPLHVTQELVETIGSSRKIVPYLDLPLQHINDQVLRRMARRVTRRETEQLLDRLREGIPNLALRTTFITGFPGETAAQFDELLQFVRRQRFERVGVFPYSFEEDTPAARLDGQVAPEVSRRRRDRLMAAQQRIAFDWCQLQVGRTLDAILDRPATDAGQPNVWLGRTPYDAPDIDGTIFVTGGAEPLQAGDLVSCEIVAARGYDLVGVAVEPARRDAPPQDAAAAGALPVLSNARLA